MGRTPARVVVVDDSALMRRLLASALTEAGFDVVAVAADGDEALAACAQHRPDVLSLDLAMPGLHGLDVLRALNKTGSTARVVVVSAFSPAYGARAVDALAEGAFELVEKPSAGTPPTAFLAELCDKVELAARSSPTNRTAATPARAVKRAVGRLGKRAVLIACSTGGPKALADLIPRLPAPLGHGGVIVQHMPPGFTHSLADRLDRKSRLTVKEASGGERLDPSTLYLAPGGSHLRLVHDACQLSDDPAIGGLRPRADLTIEDAAKAYGQDLVLVVLTGMGRDGLEGAKVVKRYGGRILAEAEETCTVYGMPRAVVEARLADDVLPLGDLPAAIAAEAGA
ncbi:MAG TPA: chemotaxis-specific protein-glutamate methyltransferase CheB [Gaiellaceae bacterium]|nr:chemotaxis-specific protein-glutamate methyltransferase CheB [Gaiellaceae bacterium]